MDVFFSADSIELFYQLIVFNFGNMGFMRLSVCSMHAALFILFCLHNKKTSSPCTVVTRDVLNIRFLKSGFGQNSTMYRISQSDSDWSFSSGSSVHP